MRTVQSHFDLKFVSISSKCVFVYVLESFTKWNFYLNYFYVEEMSIGRNCFENAKVFFFIVNFIDEKLIKKKLKIPKIFRRKKNIFKKKIQNLTKLDC